MSQTTGSRARLLLADGFKMEGVAIGAVGTTSGEICFNTGMTGYQEVFTDPSYHGQVMCMTNAHIGNYGTLSLDEESDRVQIAGLICKNFTNEHSRPLADHPIQSYFVENNLVGIAEVDTREIVRHIRDKGAMNAVISSEDLSWEELQAKLDATPNMEGLELSSLVTTAQSYEIGDESSDLRLAVFDFGTKRNILRCFAERGCFVKVFPAKTPFEEVAAWNPDGYFLSNGPGDPAAMDYAISTVKQILEAGKPLFGICLGHQLLALGLDITTYKMHNGHRGINHPVINLETGTCEITSQNHGFGVSADAILQHSDIVEVTHRNLNDQTIEGIRHRDKPAFSVQYHPEAAPGPHDSRYLFDDFISLMKQHKSA